VEQVHKTDSTADPGDRHAATERAAETPRTDLAETA
jgi:hypothetical protein